MVAFHLSSESKSDWDVEELAENIAAISGEDISLHNNLLGIKDKTEDSDHIREALKKSLISYIKEKYEAREHEIGESGMRNIEKVVLLRTIDMFWMDHLDTMEHLRDSVRLRAYGQRDPLVEYKNEAIRLFRELQEGIRSNVVSTIFKIGVAQKSSEERRETGNLVFKSNQNSDTPSDPIKSEINNLSKKAAVGRNDPCPCGSGKKYKRCHGA